MLLPLKYHLRHRLFLIIKNSEINHPLLTIAAAAAAATATAAEAAGTAVLRSPDVARQGQASSLQGRNINGAMLICGL